MFDYNSGCFFLTNFGDFLLTRNGYNRLTLTLNDDFVSVIPENLRWHAWAGNSEGITGDAMKDFVDNELFPGLQNLDVSTGNKRAVLIRDIFAGTNNYMKNGTIIRQVVNKLNEIDFNASEDRHMFGDIYEGLLRDLQSAGNYGEFYTPRAVTEIMTEIINPRLGEKVLDPACGTGGFLTSAIENIRKQDVHSVEDLKTLEETIRGQELKPLPFMLCVRKILTDFLRVFAMQKLAESEHYASLQRKLVA